MTCVQLADGATVCISGGDFAMRKVIYCPTCDQRRRFVLVWGGVWYDDVLTCLACGDSWAGGVRQERPFMPRWRQGARARAAKHWASAIPAAEYRERVMAALRASVRIDNVTEGQ